nr:protein translocase subunit SECA2, chloroplastic isoform X7 [Ipomoea trifida]
MSSGSRFTSLAEEHVNDLPYEEQGVEIDQSGNPGKVTTNHVTTNGGTTKAVHSGQKFFAPSRHRFPLQIPFPSPSRLSPPPNLLPIAEQSFVALTSHDWVFPVKVTRLRRRGRLYYATVMRQDEMFQKFNFDIEWAVKFISRITNDEDTPIEGDVLLKQVQRKHVYQRVILKVVLNSFCNEWQAEHSSNSNVENPRDD